jgi:hypothetical protein
MKRRKPVVVRRWLHSDRKKAAVIMSDSGNSNLKLTETEHSCPVGEMVGAKNAEGGKIPVLSCEGACIRGEIARQAANIVARDERFRRACHGEVFTVPGSAIAKWTLASRKVVIIDGCYLRCHGRILEHLVGEGHLIEHDALSYYGKYCDVFDIDAVPEDERMASARLVAEKVLLDFDSQA